MNLKSTVSNNSKCTVCINVFSHNWRQIINSVDNNSVWIMVDNNTMLPVKRITQNITITPEIINMSFKSKLNVLKSLTTL